MDQDTDQLLFASLQQFGFNFGNKKLTSLFDIDGDILRLVCFQFLEFMGSAVTLTSMKGQQKFRQSTKISEELKNLCNLRIDINSLLAPSKDELRKIVVAMLQKISMHEDGDNPRLNISQRGGAQAFDSYEDKIRFLQDQRRKEILKNWTSEEWIHPALGNNKFNQFRMYDNELVLESGSLSNKLIVDIIYGKMKPNLYATLAKMIDNRAQKAEMDEFIKENFYADEFQKLTEKKHAIQIEEIKKQVATEITKASKKKVIRLAEQLVEQPIQTEEEVKQQLVEEKQTIFNLEMQFQEEQVVQNPIVEPQNQESNERSINKSGADNMASGASKSSADASTNAANTSVSSRPSVQPTTQLKSKANLNISFDIEVMKQKHEAEIRKLSQAFEELTMKLEKWKTKREKMENNTQTKIEEGEILKEKNKQSKKEIDDMELIIKELDNKGGNSQTKKEIKEIEQDIDQIEVEWKEYQENDIKNMENLKDDLAKKKEAIELIRDKAKRIETEYQQLIQDIKNNQEKKGMLLEDFKRMPSGGNRQEYVKKIMEIKKNYDKQRGDIQKIVQDVKSVDESITYYQGTLERHMNELEGIYNTDAKKNESLSKQIYKIYQEYRSIFEQTLTNLREYGNKKIEARSVEAKSVLLATKHYEKSMEKLKSDIEEIKQENMQLQKTVKH